MKNNEFQCAVCKRRFEKGWTEEEALANLAEQWPGATPEECDMVCDDCLPKIGLPLVHRKLQ